MKRAVIAFFHTAWELFLMLVGVGVAYWMSNHFQESMVAFFVGLAVMLLYIANYKLAPKDEPEHPKDDDPSPPAGMTFT